MKKKYTFEIASHLKSSQEQIHLYWKGRVALYAILKAMGVSEGDEVIVPAFTCIVVPNAIIYLGAVPVYVDINPKTFNMDVELLEDAIGSRTKVILAQNTYGLSSSIESIVAIAKKHNVYTIEDCTHGFGGEYEGRPNGSYCDAAFYSSQWNKPFSTGIGGFSLISNNVLLNQLNKVNAKLEKPKFKDTLSLYLQLILRNNFLNEFNYWRALRMYRYLSRMNLVLGSSSGEEISGTDMPSHFFKASSAIQNITGVRALKSFNESLRERKKNGVMYTDFLKKHLKNHVDVEHHKNHSFLKYPLRVNDREEFMRQAEKKRIMLGDWFTSPLHPVKSNLNEWCFNKENFPHAVKAAQQVVNLQTDCMDVSKVLKFLEEHLDLIAPQHLSDTKG